MLVDALDHLVRGIVAHPDDVRVRSRTLRRGTLTVSVFTPLTGAEETEVRAEADALLRFAEPDPERRAVILRPAGNPR